MTDRKTASTITDIELDQLYRERDALRRMLNPDDLCLVDEMVTAVEQHMNRADRAEAEIAACRKQQWPQLVAHLAAALANTYELTIDDVLAEAHAAIAARQPAPAATQATDDQEQPRV